MRLKFLLLTFTVFFSASFCHSQRIQIFTTGRSESFRGLSAVSDNVVWVSGTKGTIGKTTNGGITWEWLQITGYESRDFRDIEAFDKETAVAVAVAEPAVIMLTRDGGKNWKEVYSNPAKGMFLDAMDFRNDRSGIVIGDPVGGRFFIIRTNDGGKTWKEPSPKNIPAADTGEACFAASGTNIRMLDNDDYCFVSGGTKSRLYRKGVPVDLRIVQGKETTGANSVAIWTKTKPARIVVVGGDFSKAASRDRNASLSRDGGRTWIKPSNPPYGYRSCVEFVTQEKLVTCGINGVDVSLDEGINWDAVTDEGFHVCRKAKKGNSVFLAGGDGRIGKLIW
jgi:photosystem II stability/assembly factor-like uncharacterized protein